MNFKENLYIILVGQARRNIMSICKDYDKYIKLENRFRNTTSNCELKKTSTFNLAYAYFENNEVDKAINSLKSLNMDDLTKGEKLNYYYNMLTYSIEAKDEKIVNYVMSEGKEIIDEIEEDYSVTYNIFYIKYYNYIGLYEESKKFLLALYRTDLSEAEIKYYNLLQAEYYVNTENYCEASKILNEIIKNDNLKMKNNVKFLYDLIKQCKEHGFNIEIINNEKEKENFIIHSLKKLMCIPVLYLIIMLLSNTICNFKSTIKDSVFIFFEIPFAILFFGDMFSRLLFKNSLYNLYWQEVSGDAFFCFFILSMIIVLLIYTIRNKWKHIKFISFFMLGLILMSVTNFSSLINDMQDFNYVSSNNYIEENIKINDIEKEDKVYKITLDGFENNFYISVNDKNKTINDYYIDDVVKVKYLPNSEKILDIECISEYN